MITDAPFSRIHAVSDVPGAGSTVKLTATPDERAALAAVLKLPEIKRLEATLVLKPWGREGLSVTGELSADVVQVCVVTLEPFEAEVHEEIETRYASDEAPREEGGEHEANLDAPDPLVNGSADLGALVAEHLALGLDPYPRKPGIDEAASSDPGESGPSTHRPFAGLDQLVAGASKKKN
jgi:uncharacterized metal-binding protein YceD (DUF177 family)